MRASRRAPTHAVGAKLVRFGRLFALELIRPLFAVHRVHYRVGNLEIFAISQNEEIEIERLAGSVREVGAAHVDVGLLHDAPCSLSNFKSFDFFGADQR